MAQERQINYNIKFNSDTQGLNALKKQLQELQNMTTSQYQSNNPNASTNLKEAASELMNIKKEVTQIQNALEKTFNSNLGTANLTQFRKEIQNLNLGTLYTDFNKLGPAGTNAFRKLSTEIVTTNTQLKQSHKWLDEMAISFKNTVKWGLSSSVFNNLTGAIQKAWNFTKSLDTSLNDIRIVTGKSADEMEQFAIQANRAAETLGASTRDFTEAALIYYQQGLSDAESQARAAITLKAANVTGQSAQEVSEQLTAVWNGYKVTADEAELYIDKLAAVAASTAADLEELSTGMSKVASAANAMGVDVDSLNAQLATIVSITRQAPESVGTALRTIYARMADIEAGLDTETSLGNYTEQMKQYGINVLDANNKLRDMQDVIEEVGSKWSSMSREQQVALTQVMAGTRQYNNLLALFENWDMYTDSLEVSKNALGTLQKQQDTYMESTKAHLQQLSTATERLMNSLADKKGMNSLIDAFTDLVTLTANFSESLGGGANILLMLGSIGSEVFGTQIASSIVTTINNLKAANRESENFAAELQNLNEQLANPQISNDPILKTILQMRKELNEVQPFMNQAQIDDFKARIKEVEAVHEEVTTRIQKYWEMVNKAETINPNVAGLAGKKIMSDNGIDPKTANGLQVEELFGNLDNARSLIGQVVDASKQDLEDLQKQLETIDLEFNRLQRVGFAENSRKEVKDLKQDLEELQASLKRVASNEKGLFNANELKSVEKYISQINANIEQPYKIISGKKTLTDHLYGDRSAFTSVQKGIENATKRVKEYEDETNKAFKSYDKAKTIENTNKDLEESAEAMHKPFSDALEIFRQIGEVKSFINLASGIGQFASALNSLHNIGSIFSNDDLSTGEKILQITMALGTGLAMLGNSFKLVSENASTIWTTLKKVAAAYLVHQAQAETLTASKTAEAAAEQASNIAKAEEPPLDVAAAAAEGTLTASNIPLTATFVGLAGAIWSALAPLLPFVAAIGAVVGVIALAVNAAEEDSRAVKQMQEAHEALNTQLQETKQKVQEIKDAFDDYTDALATLDSLTKGSTEWYESLNKVNEQALSILNTYPELAKLNNLFTRDAEGILRINSDVLDEYMDKLNESVAVQQAATALSAGQVTKTEARKTRNEIESSARSSLLSKENYSLYASRDDYASTQKANEINDKVSRNVDLFISNIDALSGLTQQEYENKLKSIGIDEDYISSLDNLQEKVDTCADETDEAANQIRNAAQVIAAIAYQDEEDATKSEQSIYAKRYADEYEDEYNKWLESIAYNPDTGKGGGGISKAGGASNKKAQEALAALNKAQGTNWSLERNAVRGTDKNRQLAFLDEEGNERVFSATQVATIIAAYKAKQTVDNEDLAAQADKIIASQAENLGGDKELADIILDKARTDFKDLSYEQVEAIREAYNTRDENGKSILGLTDEEAQKLGYDNAEDYLSGLEEKILSYKIEDNTEYLKEQASAMLKSAAEDLDVDEEALKVYKEGLQDINKNLEKNDKLAAQTTIDTFKFAKGMEELSEAYDDNKEILEKWAKSEKTAAELGTETASSVGEIQKALKSAYDVDFDESIIKENFDTIKKAMAGNADALNDMEVLASKQYLINIGVDTDAAYAEVENFDTYLQQLANADLQVGAEFNDQEALAGLSNFLMATKMTKDQAQAYLNKLGYEGEVEMTKVQGGTTSSDTTTYIKDKEGNIVQELHAHSDTTSEIEVPQLKSKEDGSFEPLHVIRDSKSNASMVKNNNAARASKEGGSKKEPKQEERLDDEADRYHQVDTQISKVEKELSKLQSQTDKYFGSKKIDNLNKQWDLLNTQIANYNEKLRIAQDEEDELRNKLAAQGVAFNADGTISNYMSAFQAQEDYVNGLIDQYNKLSAEQQEVWDKNKTIDNAKDNFSKFQEDMDRYDELVSDFIPELRQNVQDAIDEQIDLRIQEFNMEIEIRLNMAEAERDWNEFKKRVIDGIDEDDILGNARARLLDFSSYYNTDGTGQVQALTKQVNGLLDQLYQQDGTDWATAYGNNRAQVLEDLKDYYDQLKDSLTDILDLQEEIHEAYIDMIDEAADKFGEQVEMYETVRDLIEHDMNVIELVYGEEAYGALSKYYDRQEKNYNKQLDFQRQQKDFWYAQMQMMEEGSEEWEAAKENWLDAVDEWNSAVEEAIENLQDKYLNAINEIFQKLNNEVTAGKGLDYTNEEWELINKNAEQYLDTVDAAWGIQKLENKYMDAYDATDSIQARRQIKDIMDEELANLREQDKLTQYDIDRANMRYDIMLKQIALQEAQQNKSKTRLRRDSQGNYSYQFVADDDEIGNLQDELGDLYNSLYDFDKEHYQDNLNQLYEIWVEFQDKMTKATQINDPVARAERELLIREQYEPLMNGILQENLDIRENLQQSAFDDLAYLYKEDAENYKAMTDAEKDAFLSDLIPAWTSGIQQMADAMTAEGGFLSTVKGSLDEINEATNNYEEGLVELQETAGQSFTDIDDNIDETIDQTEDLISENDELIDSYEDQLDAIRDVVSELDELIAKYNAAEKAAIAASEAAYKYWRDQNNKAANDASSNSAAVNSGNGGSSSSGAGSSGSRSGSGGSGSGSGNGTGDGVLRVGDTATYTGKYYHDSYGGGATGSKYSGVANGIVVDILNNNPYGVHIHSADGRYRDLGWIKKSQLSGYDTGGYTGEWGNTNGKLALLHQKELVLNSTDTQNILNAVNVMRGLSGAMLDRLSAVAANSNTGTLDGEFEQNVHIEANFPNVQNSHEIEDAIDNLMNRASQRINKRG